MKIGRILRHLFLPPWRAHQLFPAGATRAIEAAIRASEKSHAGEIRFAVEAALHPLALARGVSARRRAEEVFAELRVWDTEHNSGVLIYVLLAERDVEIVADRGIAARVAQADWEQVCRAMEREFRAGRFEQGAVAGIGAVGALLARHFPSAGGGANELSDRPVLR